MRIRSISRLSEKQIPGCLAVPLGPTIFSVKKFRSGMTVHVVRDRARCPIFVVDSYHRPTYPFDRAAQAHLAWVAPR